MTTSAPLCVGYLRLRLSDDDQTEQQHVAAIAAFAEREGFAVSLVFVEKRWQRTIALHAMTAYCQAHSIRNVIVPTSRHLNHLPTLADLAEEMLEQDIGGQVWIVSPEQEAPPSQSKAAKDGGVQ
ncbi:hypothetical protein QF026_004788 [Streptomyces aurantiacus]|uniref:hypothetical protein n=1 Tax=Streptomyces aurantiacus TaxID=47760 RepID=UPI00278D20C7|nr:hypothetical protein [Streptomyces aurantiacus]MDQ0776322.1 hypothetical protein [Streptomyces aurantiacus]